MKHTRTKCIVCVGKVAAANARSKHFIDIWVNLVADGLFDPFGGHKIGFVRSGLRKAVGHLEPQGRRRQPVNKHDVATEISLNRGGEMKLPCYKKSQYESVATCKMKNGKMKFILPFFIYPDDKKRPYI